MTNPEQYPWKNAYRAAVNELDPHLLQRKIHVSDVAIAKRMRDLGQSPETLEERTAIQHAISALRILETQTPDYLELHGAGGTEELFQI